MMDFIATLDTKIFFILNGLHTKWLDPVMYWLSNTFTATPVFLLLIFLLVTVYKKKVWLPLLCIVLCITATDRITSGLMKPGFARLRPTHEPLLMEKVHTVNNYKGGNFGFASSHAANTFGIAMLSFLLLGHDVRRIRLIFLWAGLVSYTRIYLGVHYPGDILVGAFIGLAIGFLFYRLFKLIEERFFRTRAK
ncbi:MAG: phosphatase PAP2 family protein [Cyclobacteriaceae bacterium]|nr:phosphatase PAP2 family protein [Cyclobacteriaceae bacterium]